jgi:hypothetical protein
MKKSYKRIYYIFNLFLGLLLSLLSKKISFGISLPFGWIGTNLEKMHGFPFSFNSFCPSPPSFIPTGAYECFGGLNPYGFLLDVIFYVAVSYYILKIAKNIMQKKFMSTGN